MRLPLKFTVVTLVFWFKARTSNFAWREEGREKGEGEKGEGIRLLERCGGRKGRKEEGAEERERKGAKKQSVPKIEMHKTKAHNVLA